MPTINSVLGPLDTADLGFTLSHEHVLETSAGVPHVFPHFVDRQAAQWPKIVGPRRSGALRRGAPGNTYLGHLQLLLSNGRPPF